MAENVSGINEESLERLILELNDDIARIHNIFNCMQVEMNRTNIAAQCEALNQLRIQFQQAASNFSLVETNLSSYLEDLTNVKYHYLLKNDDLATYVRKQQQNMMQNQ